MNKKYVIVDPKLSSQSRWMTQSELLTESEYCFWWKIIGAIAPFLFSIGGQYVKAYSLYIKLSLGQQT